ncbi:MAG: DoxX family protein [Campylobacterales bacterium]|nr:DoxX family protein [Campylobacterales bacterium]
MKCFIPKNEDVGKLILRFSVGFMMLFHGISKLNGVDWMKGMLSGAGLPEFLAYGVYLGEIVAPILILIGFKARHGAVLIIITMLFAIFLVHPTDIFALTEHGAWAIELHMFYIFSSLAIIFLGSGKYSIDKE